MFQPNSILYQDFSPLDLAKNFEKVCLSYKNESIQMTIFCKDGLCPKDQYNVENQLKNSVQNKNEDQAQITPKMPMKFDQTQNQNIDWLLTQKKVNQEDPVRLSGKKDKEIQIELISQLKCTRDSQKYLDQINFQNDKQNSQQNNQIINEDSQLSIIMGEEDESMKASDFEAIKNLQLNQENKDQTQLKQNNASQEHIKLQKQLHKNYSLSENKQIQNKLMIEPSQLKKKSNFFKFDQDFFRNQITENKKESSNEQISIDDAKEKEDETDYNIKEKTQLKEENQLIDLNEENLSVTKQKKIKNNLPPMNPSRRSIKPNEFFKKKEESQLTENRRFKFGGFGQNIFQKDFFGNRKEEAVQENENNLSKISRKSRRINLDDFKDTESYKNI